MKYAKPQWNLATALLPPIILSLISIVFLSSSVFWLLCTLLGISIIPTLGLIANSDLLSTQYPVEKFASQVNTLRWILSVIGILFLLTVSTVFIIFLTASSQLSPDELTFGKVTHMGFIVLTIGFCFLAAHIMMMFFQSQKKIRQTHQEKVRLNLEIFTGFNAFIAIVISMTVVIFSMATAFMHLGNAEVTSGAQLQTIVCVMALWLPLIIKSWRHKVPKNLEKERVGLFFKRSSLLLAAIILLTLLTLPIPNIPIHLLFIQYGLQDTQWKLLILGWWIGITPLVTTHIMRLSTGRSFLQILLVLILGLSLSGLFYFQFLSSALDYFLAVLRGNPLALILAGMPLGLFTLNVARFQGTKEVTLTSFDLRKQIRDRKYFFDALIKGITIACGLYWISGLSILWLLLMIVAIPSLVLFVRVSSELLFAGKAGQKSYKNIKDKDIL